MLHIRHMQKSVQERNEQVNEYHSITHTHTHTHTHGRNSAAGQEKEHWEHQGPLVYPPGTIAFPPPKIKVTLPKKKKVTLPYVCQSLSRVGLFCDPRDCSPPDSSVCGTFQARTLEWVTKPFCRGSSQPRDQTGVSHIAGRFLTF